MNKSIFNECLDKAYPSPSSDPELLKFFECVVKDVIEKTREAVFCECDVPEADRVKERLMCWYGVEE